MTSIYVKFLETHGFTVAEKNADQDWIRAENFQSVHLYYNRLAGPRTNC